MKKLLIAAALFGSCQSAFANYNLNDASCDQLASVSGIGPGKAHAIVTSRLTSSFRSVDDLLRLNVFDRKLVDEIKAGGRVYAAPAQNPFRMLQGCAQPAPAPAPPPVATPAPQPTPGPKPRPPLPSENEVVRNKPGYARP
jgi:competence protein ComEA